jgi:hypothetical protein
VWGNHSSVNPATLLDDYATVYLFFQWLRLQAGGTGIYREILFSPFFDHRAVTAVANRAMPGRGYTDWEILLGTWLAANYINARSGPYGYLNDPDLKHVRPRYLSGAGGSHLLHPGEGVFTRRTSMPIMTSNFIRYAGLPERGSLGAPTTTGSSGFTTLLSYNINTEIESPPSPSTPFSAETVFSAEIYPRNMTTLSSPQSLLSAPFAIGARDLLRVNSRFEESLFTLDFAIPRVRINAGE